jgi:MoaD family protein
MLYKVNFYSTLRQSVGAKTVEIDLDPQPTIRLVVAEVTRLYPALADEMVDKNGELLSHIKIFVNGRLIYFLEDGLDTKVTAENTISIFPAVGGG